LSSFFDTFVDSKGFAEFVRSILTSFVKFLPVSGPSAEAVWEDPVEGNALALAWSI
jgi:hypothetical protein